MPTRRRCCGRKRDSYRRYTRACTSSRLCPHLGGRGSTRQAQHWPAADLAWRKAQRWVVSVRLLALPPKRPGRKRALAVLQRAQCTRQAPSPHAGARQHPSCCARMQHAAHAHARARQLLLRCARAAPPPAPHRALADLADDERLGPMNWYATVATPHCSARRSACEQLPGGSGRPLSALPPAGWQPTRAPAQGAGCAVTQCWAGLQCWIAVLDCCAGLQCWQRWRRQRRRHAAAATRQ